MELDLDYIKSNVDSLKNNRWLLVSSLQKSVRRGLANEAANLWDVAKELDKFHVMYRASIIAIEDVGLGNPELVHDFLSTSLKKANLAEKGGDDYVRKVIIDLSNSVKDRTACDATWLASKISPPNLENITLEQYYRDNQLDIIERSLAGWLLVGTKKIKHGLLTEKDEQSNIELFLDINKDLGVDEKILEVVKASYGYHKEPHIFAYPLLSLALKNEQERKMGSFTTGDPFGKDFDTPIYYHRGIPILMSAVDGHTSEGKKVLEKVKQQANIQKIISHLPEEVQSYLLKHALFKAEGQVVNKRLFYPTASQIYKKSQTFFEDGKIIKELTQEVESMIPEINNMRESVLNYTFKKGYKPKY